MQLRPVSFQALPTSASLSATPSADERLALERLEGDREELSRLQRLAPPGASLSDLACFHRMGRQQSDESLASSLQWVQGALTTSGGALGKLSSEDRVEVLRTLLKAHPGQPLEARFPGGELSELSKEVGRFMDGDAHCLLGEQRYMVPLQQPRRPISLVQAARDYAGALERILKSPGRIDPEMQPDDREWALDCVRIENAHLHQAPGRVSLFRKLVSTFQDPAIAHVVMLEVESLPVARQDAYLSTLTGEMAGLGPHETDWEKTRKEGEHVKGLAAGVQLVMQVARPEDNPSALLAELRQLARRPGSDEQLIRGGAWRGPGQSWAQGLQNDPRTELKREDDLRLAEAVYQRSRTRGEEHGELLEQVKGFSFRLHEPNYLSVIVHALGLDEPLDQGLERTVREYEMTGKVDALSPIRKEIGQALASGAVKGDLDTLMKRYELIYVQRTTGGENKEKALQSSLAELLEVAQPARSGVVQTNGAVWVGGVRVRKAGS